MKRNLRVLLAGRITFLLGVLFSACSLDVLSFSKRLANETLSSQTVLPSATLSPPETVELTIAPTQSPTPTLTEIPTLTPTFTPSPTLSPQPSPTPTPSQAWLTVMQKAHCRYGAGRAYLHAGDLYPGETALIEGRNASGSWLWIRIAKLWYNCWVAKSVVETHGDLSSVPFVTTRLPMSLAGLYEPPKKVWAERDKDEVTVHWKEVWMTEDDDRGYLIEAFVCQEGSLVFLAVWTDGDYYTFHDERKGCSQASSGKLYAVEKHGYLPPVMIPWP